MHTLRIIFAVAVSLFAIAATCKTQPAETSDSDYIAQALSAAPKAVAKGAAVVRVQNDGSMRTVRPGTNGFTCMIMGTDKMCNDTNSMEFIDAMMKHEQPPDKVGISYMLAGDDGSRRRKYCFRFTLGVLSRYREANGTPRINPLIAKNNSTLRFAKPVLKIHEHGMAPRSRAA